MQMKKKIYHPRLIKYKKYLDKKGYLVPFEIKNQKIKINDFFSFSIKRIFFSLGKKNYFRGDHAHQKCSQLLICLNGSISVETIYHFKKKIFNISRKKNFALLIPPMVWNRLYFKNNDSLLTVLCDYKYDNKNEYINNYNEFKKLSI